MGVDAQYHLRFKFGAFAKAALEVMSTPVADFPDLRETETDSGVEDRLWTRMFMSIADWDTNIITVASLGRYLDVELILNAKPGMDLGDLEYHRAVGILLDLEHLRSFPEMDGVEIFYLSDHHPRGSMGDRVTEEFLSGLWNLTASRA